MGGGSSVERLQRVLGGAGHWGQGEKRDTKPRKNPPTENKGKKWEECAESVQRLDGAEGPETARDGSSERDLMEKSLLLLLEAVALLLVTAAACAASSATCRAEQHHDPRAVRHWQTSGPRPMIASEAVPSQALSSQSFVVSRFT
eukprot:248987-Rhodomonas_salina.1